MRKTFDRSAYFYSGRFAYSQSKKRIVNAERSRHGNEGIDAVIAFASIEGNAESIVTFG